MLKIEDNRMYFHQWDMNQRLLVENEEIKEVHYSNGGDTALICEVFEEDGKRYVNVPNILLQTEWTIKAYAVCGDCITRDAASFIVMPRAKPADYVYTETEVKTYAALAERIEALENADSPEQTGVFIIKVNKIKELDENGRYVDTHKMNKTYQEIKEAYEKGNILICNYQYVAYEDNYIPFVIRNIDDYIFKGVANSVTLSDSINNYITITISEKNIRIYKDKIMTRENTYALPNPQSLNITIGDSPINTRYDGSEQVDLKIPAPTTTLPWDAITDKPFGDGTILPETQIEIFDGVTPLMQEISLAEGIEYTVNINGVEYTSKAVYFNLEGINTVIIGNTVMVTNIDNGQPFMIVAFKTPLVDGGISAYGMMQIFNEALFPVGDIITLSIYTGNGVKTLESQYIPTATETVKGGVIVGEGLQMDGEVLSVNEPIWEHIETITVDEEGLKKITRDTFPDGTPYNLSAAKVIARIFYPLTANVATAVDFMDSDGTELGYVVSRIPKGTYEEPQYKSTAIYQAKPVWGMYEFMSMSGAQGEIMSVYAPSNGNYQTTTTNKKINKIEFIRWDSGTIPLRTQVELWGVRA